MNINSLRLKSGLIGKINAPKDTFNLARSIITRETNKGFDVIQKESRAFYGAIINDGRTDRPLSAKEKANVDWWDDRTLNGILRFIATNQNGLQKEYQQVAKWAKGTPAQQKAFARSLARSGK